MRDRHAVFPALLAVAVLGSPFAWCATGPDLPNRFVPALDGEPVAVELPAEGIEVVAWAYRAGAEYDLAVATRVGRGPWESPLLIGADDRVDQVDPAFAVDLSGTAYLVYAVRPAGALFLTVRAPGLRGWSSPIQVAPVESRAAAPVARIVADRLVIAFRSGRGTSVVDLPLWNVATGTLGIHDGPDGVDPLGAQPEDDSKGTPIGGG